MANSLESSPSPLQRLHITLKQPNPLFEKWLESWLQEAERRNTKSQYKLREALQALRSFPLPLATGRECAVLRGFGSTLCRLIDEELLQLKQQQQQKTSSSHPLNINSAVDFQQEVQQVVATVSKAAGTRRKQQPQSQKSEKPSKLTKKAEKALADEEERQRQVTMAPGSFRVLLLVDIQETSGKHKRTLDQTRSYLETLGVAYEVRRLTVGDFLWVARNEPDDGSSSSELVLPYIVERKRMDDLAASIRDGRFHEQKHRLRQCGIPNVVYLVEDYGDNEQLGLPLESLQQAMANTQLQAGFAVARTKNHWRSMVHLQYMTQTMIKLFKDKLLIGTAKEDLIAASASFDPHARCIGLMKFRELYEDSARNAQLSVREVFVQQLLQLHSLSLEKALAIVAVYATPRLLFDAYAACTGGEQEARLLLANVRCGQLQRPVGEKISQTIYDFYRTDF